MLNLEQIENEILMDSIQCVSRRIDDYKDALVNKSPNLEQMKYYTIEEIENLLSFIKGNIIK